MLRHGLALEAEHGIDPALVCCDVSNVGSAAVIEGCGGVFERLGQRQDGDGGPVKRYWVPTTR